MPIKLSIDRTIDYLKKYQNGVSCEDIMTRLIGSEKFSNEEIKKELEMYRNLSNNKVDQKKIKLAKKMVDNYLTEFDDILMVAITGSVATGHPKDNDDIDLLIVTRKNSLWLVRLLTRISLWLGGVSLRSAGKDSSNNDFCLNLWMEEESLLVPPSRQNLRTAMDLILMKPIIDRGNIYAKMISQNSWARKYVVNAYDNLVNKEILSLPGDESNRRGKVLVNLMAYIGQYVYMSGKIKDEIVSLRQAFFHKVL